MIRRRVYPGTFDRSQWDANQSDSEHQRMPVSDPYDNSYQGDIASLGYDTLYEQQELDAAAAAGSGTSGAAPQQGGACAGAFVSYTWDSRPVAAQDKYSDGHASAFPSATDQQGTFTVPQGNIGIVRTITFTPGAFVGPVITINGTPTDNYLITILKNGLPIPGFTLIDVSPGFPSGGEIECFIMMQPGEVLTGNAFLGGVVVDSSTILVQPVGFRFWGTLLPNDGRTILEQAGNMLPQPVCLDSGSIAQIKPPPLVIPTANGPVVVPQGNANPPMKTMAKCTLPPAVSVNDYLACVNAAGAAYNNS